MTEDRAALVGLKRFRPTLQKYAASRTGYLAVMTDKDDPRDSDWRGEDSRQWVKYEDVAAALAMQPPSCAEPWGCDRPAGHDGPHRKPAMQPPGDGGPPCSTHPDAPHGFDRNGSHNAERYVCDCEGWVPDDHAAQLAAKDSFAETLRDAAREATRQWIAANERVTAAEQRVEAAMGLLREVVEAHTGENIDGCGMTNQQIAAIAAFIAGGAAEVDCG